MESEFIRINEKSDAILSLQIIEKNFQYVLSDNKYWKLIIISLHSALQGFMVCALQGTSYFNVAEKKSLKKHIESLKDKSKPYTTVRLQSFMKLYERIKNADELKNHYVATDECNSAIISLNDIRNDFIHFSPKGWSLSIDGLPIIMDCSLDIIEFLVFKTIESYQFTNEEREVIKKLIDNIRILTIRIFTITPSNSVFTGGAGGMC
ncbi:hypothetical protein [Alkaliphilus peptidifermentans]|uniref:Uncharacterized protein n=1 Tax=Alkaliphilus peptidifermentans DSM 18978 TaxID=1120976 RepID=A0A1G5LGZ2_9FIRM|nr:hypothetical protein [Alkaliphilus peptidifermentans]SCZ11429.1 hypothetical protein SAMN03080606_04363 [Alkaliphilus peptidifermentans DSM 18978]